MTPFTKTMHEHLQSLFAPKQQLYAESYGQPPADTSNSREIKSEAPPAAAAPAQTIPNESPPQQGAPSPIIDVVQDLSGGGGTKTGIAGGGDVGMGPNAGDPYGGMGPPQAPNDAPQQESPAGAVVDPSLEPWNHPALYPDYARGTAPGDPHVAPPVVDATPQVDYQQMYADQMRRRGGFKNYDQMQIAEV